MYEGFVRQKQMAAANTTPRRRVAFEEKTTAVLYCCCCRFFPSDLNPIASFGWCHCYTTPSQSRTEELRATELLPKLNAVCVAKLLLSGDSNVAPLQEEEGFRLLQRLLLLPLLNFGRSMAASVVAAFCLNTNIRWHRYRRSTIALINLPPVPVGRKQPHQAVAVLAAAVVLLPQQEKITTTTKRRSSLEREGRRQRQRLRW